MATLNLGRIKPVFRGAYSGSTAYVVDDIVTHGNESFICIQAHGAGTQATTQTAYWTKLAAKGTDGTDVGTTITTQGDILYRDGSGLQRLAKGTAAQVLAINSGATAPEWVDASGGKTIKRHYFEMSTRTAGTNSAGDQFNFTASFIPIDPVNNDLYIQAVCPVNLTGNDWSGMGLRFSKSGGSDYDFFGRGVQYVDSSATMYMGIQSQYWNMAAGTIPAGTYNIALRTETDGSQPNMFSPNSTDDSRLATQTRSTLMITEWKN